MGRNDLEKMDADNNAGVEAYLSNIQVMEQITRLNTNLALLKKHLAQTKESGQATIEVEVCGLRVGNFRMVTFPGELTVEVGLNIKRAARLPHCFVAGYTNGYIYYAPTFEHRNNPGYAQEDCDTLVAPEWQKIFEAKSLEILKGLWACPSRCDMKTATATISASRRNMESGRFKSYVARAVLN